MSNHLYIFSISFYLCVHVVSKYISYQQDQWDDSILLHWPINFHAIFSLLFVYFTYVTCIRLSIDMLRKKVWTLKIKYLSTCIYIGNKQIICSPILLDFIVTRTQNWNKKDIYYVLIYKIIPHSIN